MLRNALHDARLRQLQHILRMAQLVFGAGAKALQVHGVGVVVA